jgi:hypothetical protein
MRIEPHAARPGGRGVVFMPFVTPTSIVLLSQQHGDMKMPAQSQSQPMRYASAYFRAGDVENGGGDLAKTSHAQSESCHKAGDETVNRPSSVKYEGTNAKTATSDNSGLISSFGFP